MMLDRVDGEDVGMVEPDAAFASRISRSRASGSSEEIPAGIQSDLSIQ